ncbi:MAG: ABC transporter permease [Acidiferrobacterales bacterium]
MENADSGLTKNETHQQAGLSAWLNVNTRYWRYSSLLIALVIAIPILVVFAAWLQPAGDVWQHLVDTVLAELLTNTFALLIGVGLGVLFIGTGLAWLTAMCDFPGRKFLDWALMLPLAVPAYVLAFVMVGLFDFSGPLLSGLRAQGFDTVSFPEIRSTTGIILVMVLAFYPYVYMLARLAFISQGRNLLDSGRVLGLGPWAAFYKVALPMARPAIAAGVALALMETLADFGAVSVFNYDTFTTAIYKTWMGLFNITAAAQLASILLLFVITALYIERRLRLRARYETDSKTSKELRFVLTGFQKYSAIFFCFTVLFIAFAIPVIQLFIWAWEVIAQDLDSRYFRFLFNTLFLGLFAAFLASFGALMLAYTYRLRPDRFTKITVRLATVGYALPGSVLAVGIMLVVVWLDNKFLEMIQRTTGFEIQPILTGSILILIIAYVTRFMAVAYGPIDSAFDRIRPSVIQAARSLGAGNWKILWRVSMPMLSGGLLSAMLLVFVEVMKEMPATLLLRPFGWDTLATRIFELTSEGEWERAALPALALILAGLLPVILLIKKSRDR